MENLNIFEAIDDLKRDRAKATEALQFYEDYADKFQFQTESDKYPDFNWRECSAVCYLGSMPKRVQLTSGVVETYTERYSHSRFMEYVSKYFGVTVAEMKCQWRNIK